MLLGEAAAAVGLDEHDDEDACVVAFPNGSPVNRTLRQVAARSMDQMRDLYHAGATFTRGSIQPHQGRRRENVKRILWLPFDFDLIDWLGGYETPGPERTAAIAKLHALEQEDLDDLINAQRPDVEAAMGGAGLPVHRLDYTGYGLCAYTYCAAGGRVDEWVGVYRAAVGHLNALTGRTLADRQVSDAGTRITRLVPCLNTKGARPRVAHTLSLSPGFATVEDLRDVIGSSPPPRPALVALPQARSLSDAQLQEITDTLAPLWGKGFRHWMALGLSGFLAKAGVPMEQAERIVWALADSDDEMDNRLEAVGTTYARIAKGEQIAGYTALRQMLPSHTLAWLDDALAPKTGAKVTALKAVPPREPDPEPATPARRFAEAPKAAYCSWLESYTDLMLPTTEAPAAFHLAVGLTIAGAVFGKRISTFDGGDLVYPNQYTLLIGDSATSKKDTACRRGLTLARLPMRSGTTVGGSPFHTSFNAASAPALIQMLGDFPATLLFQSEYSVLVHAGKRDVTKDLMPTIMEAWSCPDRIENNTKRVGNQEAPGADNPFLCLLTTTQPRTMADLATGGDMHTGWLNRHLIVVGEGNGPKAVAGRLDLVQAQKLWNWTIEARDRAKGEIPWSAAAEERWAEWYDAQYERRPNESDDDRAMRGRHGTLVWKIALTHAALDYSDAIGLDHLEAGIATVEWSWENLRLLVGEWGASIDSILEQRIRRIFLDGDGLLTRRQVQGKASDKRWSGVDFGRVWDAMVKNEELRAHTDGWILES